ncbi:MAG: hypothetical protein M3134_03260 [Actinomycetota bacterium]|nr:hypothetical protein [Actinomycetota bacterium]
MSYLDDLRGVAAANLEEIESDVAQTRLAARHSREQAEALEDRARVLEGLLTLGAELRSAEQSHRQSLYDAMINVIGRSPLRMMRAADMAAEINRLGLYKMQDGRPVEAQQIRVRAGKRPDLFQRDGTFIKLASSPSATS